MKNAFLFISIIGLLGSVLVRAAETVYPENERLKSTRITKLICENLVDEENFGRMQISIDECVAGKFRVSRKTTDKHEDEGKTYVTIMDVVASVKNIVCEVGLKRSFSSYVVLLSGDIVKREKAWYVDIASCTSQTNRTVMEAKLSDSNVKKMTKKAFNKLPEEIQSNIGSVDLSFELGDGYYDYVGSPKYYKVLDPSTKKVVGYIEVSVLSYTEASAGDPDEEYTVRYNSKGERISAVGDYY